jgi:hypothetical protein
LYVAGYLHSRCSQDWRPLEKPRGNLAGAACKAESAGSGPHYCY